MKEKEQDAYWQTLCEDIAQDVCNKSQALRYRIKGGDADKDIYLGLRRMQQELDELLAPKQD